jgi:two-component system chemotaxis response regulator CheB
VSGVVPEAVVIGASAGALEVLSNLLPALPSDYRLPILIVVHLPPDNTSLFAELIRARCAIRVREAEDKEPIEPGVVYFAPPDYHLLVEEDKRLSLSDDEPVLFSRPSIDVLFESAADAYAGGLIGVVLTGALRLWSKQAAWRSCRVRGAPMRSRCRRLPSLPAPRLAFCR